MFKKNLQFVETGQSFPNAETAIPAPEPAPRETRLSAPSSLYRQEFWMVGLWIIRVIPRKICALLARIFASLYWAVARERREVVIQNLLPATQGNRNEATRVAKKLFHQFARKIVDLWQYEAGMPILQLQAESSGWEHFVKAHESGRGVLLVTPHLGNWEFGGPWLTRRGVPLHVITMAEPGKDFTQLRQASRARWNIETVVIGNDPFAFVEIIRLLESGATVALLMDRPSSPTAIDVELFGKTFPASVAATELARASGCVLLPVYLPRVGNGYAARVLPEIPYERSALRDRVARHHLTQEIMRAFEPVIREHLDQWYHFGPVWKE
jgi:KDO2-lipid IV(A) lauroyltransferase